MNILEKAKKQLRLALAQIRTHKFLLIGLAAIIFMYVGVAGLISVTTPWYRARGDTIPHIDYIWRLSEGDIPKYDQGITYPPFVERGGGKGYQQSSPNPPLFYAIHAPLVGPLLQQGDWKKAIAVGRAINIFIGILCIFALAWAGWLFGGEKRRELFAIAVPALTSLTYWFLRLNRDFALDGLLCLMTTLTCVSIYKILQQGPRPKYLISLSVIAAAGMATKAPYIVFLLVGLLAVVVSSVIHGRKNKLKSFAKGVVLSASIFVVVLASIGWFYYLWNYRSSGQWITSFPTDLNVGNRPYKSLEQVMTSPLFWALFYARYSPIPVLSTAITSFAVAGYFNMKRITIKIYDKYQWAIALMILATLGIILTQIRLAVGYGSLNFRYLLPALLPIGLFLAYGLLEFRKLRGQLVAAAALIMTWTTLLSLKVSPTTERLLSSPDTWDDGIRKIFTTATKNNVPFEVSLLLFIILIIGSLALPVALFFLSKDGKPKSLRTSTQ